MLKYASPALVYSKTVNVPVLSYRLNEPGCTVTRYRWLVGKGTSLEFRDAQILVRGRGNGFKRHHFHGKSVRAKGHYKELDRVLQGEIEREPLLPQDDELDDWFDGENFATMHDRKGLDEHHRELTAEFCRILNGHFDAGEGHVAVNDTAGLDKLFKGLTFTRSRSAPGFFMKAIKSGYEALGFYRKTYRGIRLYNFGIGDLVSYIRKHRQAWPRSIAFDFRLIPGFDIRFCGDVDESDDRGPFAIPGMNRAHQGLPKAYLRLIGETMRHWASRNGKMPYRDDPFGLDTSEVVKQKKPVIVHEYGFRGDGRSPLVLFHTGGLHPNAVRHYEDETARQDFDNRRLALEKRAKEDYGHKIPHFDPYLHQHKYDAISVFLSVSRTPSVARQFIVDYSDGDGYIYLLRCPGAVDQEATFARVQHFGEQEISVPGGVDWDDIIATRPVVKGQPLPYCYVNEKNPWRNRERAVQDAAIRRLLKFDS